MGKSRVPKEKFNADLIKQLMVGREMVGAYYREDFKPSHEDEVVLSVEHITQGIVYRLWQNEATTHHHL